MSAVVCKLPKAGLGNQLFPLMNAVIFSRLNNLPLIITGYHQFKLGPYLRKEKSKRKYIGYFRFQKNIFGEMLDRAKVSFLKKKWKPVFEPPVKLLAQDELSGKIFFFEKLPTYHDYFINLKNYRTEVKESLKLLLKPQVLKEVERAEKPVIAVHIRMGDFRKLKEGEDFSRVGHVRTPEKYFIGAIETIRKLSPADLPVTIFTDGYREEFEELFNIPLIKMANGNSDIVDLLLLSRSRLIVTATGSTFSYWAGFLADAPIIIHPDHVHAPLRPAELNEKYYEGSLDEKAVSPLLKANILAVFQ